MWGWLRQQKQLEPSGPFQAQSLLLGLNGPPAEGAGWILISVQLPFYQAKEAGLSCCLSPGSLAEKGLLNDLAEMPGRAAGAPGMSCCWPIPWDTPPPSLGTRQGKLLLFLELCSQAFSRLLLASHCPGKCLMSKDGQNSPPGAPRDAAVESLVCQAVFWHPEVKKERGACEPQSRLL